MKQRIARFVRHRVPLPVDRINESLREAIPVHLKQWVWCLGGTPALLFGILVATGVLLMFYYVPDPDHAYASVARITTKVRLGWFVRGLHHASAHLMVLAVLLHMYRVFGTRAYRKPREVNWMVGVALLLTVLGFAFTGYSLVYDQLSYWATTVGTNMIGAVPLVGEPMLNFIRGGPDVSPDTLTRFFFFHIGILPVVMTLLIVTHVVLIRLHGVAPLEDDPRTETYPFFPDHVLKETIVGLLVLVGLVNYVIFFPPELGPPADPAVTPGEIKPEWYFYPPFRWLKIVPMQAGLWGSLLFVVCMFLWPFIDRGLEALAPRKQLGRIVGSAAILFLLALLVWEAFAG